jgi:antitoxin MazE
MGKRLDKSINNVYTLGIFVDILEVYMTTVLQKWGNSIGIRLPRRLLNDYSLRIGSKVELKESQDGIFMMPEETNSLSHLLSGITEENIHAEIETGIAVGKEIW